MKTGLTLLIVLLISINQTSFSQDKIINREIGINLSNGGWLLSNSYLGELITPNLSIKLNKNEFYGGVVIHSINYNIFGIEGGYRYYFPEINKFFEIYFEGNIKYLPYKSGPGPEVNINSTNIYPYPYGTENRELLTSYSFGFKLTAFKRVYLTSGFGYSFLWNFQKEVWSSKKNIYTENNFFLRIGIGIKLFKDIEFSELNRRSSS